jgi:hypothetical protein
VNTGSQMKYVNYRVDRVLRERIEVIVILMQDGKIKKRLILLQKVLSN